MPSGSFSKELGDKHFEFLRMFNSGQAIAVKQIDIPPFSLPGWPSRRMVSHPNLGFYGIRFPVIRSLKDWQQFDTTEGTLSVKWVRGDVYSVFYFYGPIRFYLQYPLESNIVRHLEVDSFDFSLPKRAQTLILLDFLKEMLLHRLILLAKTMGSLGERDSKVYKEAFSPFFPTIAANILEEI